MGLLYSTEEKFPGGKTWISKVQCETSLYRVCGSCAGHRARCGLVVKMTTDLLPDMSFQYALVITTDMGSKSGTGGK